MRKSTRYLTALMLGAGSTMLATSPSFSMPITYTEQTAASGSLGGVAFTDASIVLRMATDTTGIVSGGPGSFFNFGTATVSVSGGAPATFTTAIEVLSGAGALGPTVGFKAVISSDILDTASASFAGYGLATSIGPITGMGLFSSAVSYATTAGAFILNSVGDATFTATTGLGTPAPEPASLTLLGVALAGLGLIRRRKMP